MLFVIVSGSVTPSKTKPVTTTSFLSPSRPVTTATTANVNVNARVAATAAAIAGSNVKRLTTPSNRPITTTTPSANRTTTNTTAVAAAAASDRIDEIFDLTQDEDQQEAEAVKDEEEDEEEQFPVSQRSNLFARKAGMTKSTNKKT